MCYCLTFLFAHRREKNMGKANNDIREALKKSGVKQWELADKLGVANTRLCEKLRHELSGEEKCRIFNLIAEILEERKVEA